MGVVRTLEDLARIGRQRTISDRSVHLHQDEVTTDLRAARLDLEAQAGRLDEVDHEAFFFLVSLRR